MEREWIEGLPAWLQILLTAGAAIAAAVAVHWAIIFVLRRAASRTATTTDDILLQRFVRPARWVLIAFALSFVEPLMPLPVPLQSAWSRISGLLVPALMGWLAVALLGAINDIVQDGTDFSGANNLAMRRRRTRVSILHRVGLFIVLLITFCMMLMSIPSVRSIGVTLIASAGLAGLAVGAAAQPALKNLIAGIQMAFSEPIRIDDVVIVDGEWGRIGEIRLTYVVVNLWDERRLIVPVSKFLESSFQNWTRETSQLLGTVLWYLDPAADIARLREKLGEIVKANKRWDGRFFNMQVTDMKAEVIEVRALVTAADAGTAFDLRCDVREAILAFIAEEMPEALPRRRQEVAEYGSQAREFLSGAGREFGRMAESTPA